jgi:hypothetical protein
MDLRKASAVDKIQQVFLYMRGAKVYALCLFSGFRLYLVYNNWQLFSFSTLRSMRCIILMWRKHPIQKPYTLCLYFEVMLIMRGLTQ